MSNVIFSQFVGAVIQLDKTMYLSIQENPATQTLTPEEKLKLYSPDFQAKVSSLFEAHEAHQNATQRLGIAVFGLVSMTDSTFDEAAVLLETGLNRIYSRSYLARLFKIGALLTEKPELSSVKDVEKLTSLARVPKARLDAVLSSINVAAATRDQVNEIVKAETGMKAPEATEPKAPKAPNYSKALKQIESIAHDMGTDPELSVLFERISSVLTARIAASTETKSVKSA